MPEYVMPNQCKNCNPTLKSDCIESVLTVSRIFSLEVAISNPGIISQPLGQDFLDNMGDMRHTLGEFIMDHFNGIDERGCNANRGERFAWFCITAANSRPDQNIEAPNDLSGL